MADSDATVFDGGVGRVNSKRQRHGGSHPQNTTIAAEAKLPAAIGHAVVVNGSRVRPR